MKRRILRPSALLIAVLLFAGCGGSAGEADSAWTVQEDALILDETLRVTEGEDFFIGEIYDVAVREDGRIYVADGQATHVKVLAADGTLLDTIGRQGEGPGEFRSMPTQVVLARGDSLYVLDAYSGHVSVFAPDHTFARGFSIRPGTPLQLFVPEERAGFAAIYRGFGTSEEPPRVIARRLGPAGSVEDTLFTTPPLGMHIEERGGQVTREGIPFSRSPHYANGPAGAIHYAWSDSLVATQFTLAGDRGGTVDVPFEPVPVTAEDRARRMGERSWRGSEEAIRSKIPETKPAFDRFLVDDEGRYWFGRSTAHADSIAWWVAQPETQHVATATLSDEVRLMTVRDGHAYGRTTTEEGAPVLVRFQVSVGS